MLASTSDSMIFWGFQNPAQHTNRHKTIHLLQQVFNESLLGIMLKTVTIKMKLIWSLPTKSSQYPRENKQTNKKLITTEHMKLGPICSCRNNLFLLSVIHEKSHGRVFWNGQLVLLRDLHLLDSKTFGRKHTYTHTNYPETYKKCSHSNWKIWEWD